LQKRRDKKKKPAGDAVQKCKKSANGNGESRKTGKRPGAEGKKPAFARGSGGKGKESRPSPKKKNIPGGEGGKRQKWERD